MDKKRYQEWTIGMMSVQGVHMWMYEVVKGLARIDAKLVDEDKWVSSVLDWNIQSSEDVDRLSDHLTISGLWVMGAYEFVRTFRQRLKNNKHYQLAIFKDLVEKYEKVRIPLAKLEAPRNFPELSVIARPAIQVGYGICWKVGEGEFITRRELADALIIAISQYRHYGDVLSFFPELKKLEE